MSHNHCYSNNVDISGTIFTMNVSKLILKSQREEGCQQYFGYSGFMEFYGNFI